MTIEQQRKLELLSLCTFRPASWPKRFVRQLASSDYTDKELTPKQVYWLDRLFFMYRGQIMAHTAGWQTANVPAFVDPPLPPESVTVSEDEVQESPVDPRKVRRLREANEKLEAWNRAVLGDES